MSLSYRKKSGFAFKDFKLFDITGIYAVTGGPYNIGT